jgi:hypothetical protein
MIDIDQKLMCPTQFNPLLVFLASLMTYFMIYNNETNLIVILLYVTITSTASVV